VLADEIKRPWQFSFSMHVFSAMSTTRTYLVADIADMRVPTLADFSKSQIDELEYIYSMRVQMLSRQEKITVEEAQKRMDERYPNGLYELNRAGTHRRITTTEGNRTFRPETMNWHPPKARQMMAAIRAAARAARDPYPAEQIICDQPPIVDAEHAT